MTDVEHLEKMGRELKCPVCLSLLKSAVSLGCNHIFCGSCISSSMKLAMSCPVCKVPFRRREVRPAPQMDNLVSIYRNMEIAAGVGIHNSQFTALVKHSDGSFHGEQEPNSFMSEANKICKRKAKKKPICKKGSKQLLKENSMLERDSRFSMLPSIPTNKRVNVTPYPISETPFQPEKVIGPVDTCCGINVESDINLQESYDKPTLSKKESGSRETVAPVLSPFFWLREESESNDDASHASSQQAAGSDVSLPEIPCFSDIKDSYCCTPLKMTPTNKSNTDQIFDSEIFEWTQRLCSPELCSTPVKHQTVDTHGSGNKTVVQSEMVSETQLGENATVGGRKRKNMKHGKGLSCKMQRINAGNSTKRINAMKDAKENSAMFESPNLIHTNVEIDVKNSRRKRSTVGKLSACSSKRNARKCRNKVDANEKEEQYEPVPCQMLDADVQDECTFNKKSLLSTNYREKNEMSDKIYEGTEDDGIYGKNSCKSWEKRLKITSNAASAEIMEVTPSPCQDAMMLDQSMGIHLPVSPCYKDKDIQQTETAGRSQENTKTRSCVQKTDVKQSNKKKRITKHCSHTSLLNDENDGTYKDDCVRVATECLALQKKKKRKVKQEKKTSTNENFMVAKEQNETFIARIADEIDAVSSDLQEKPGNIDLENSERPVEIVTTVEQHGLKKCNRISSQIRCEFCKSSEETEISGKMMHYFKCKPVASDYNAGADVVHTHKHCTEWAPNVYFENEVAINLTSELARSKRIKCCCCGIKGAALGCFEKSCRKSYHFTCAKFVPQCRWDAEKFVMLCPSHASSRLPCEVSPTEKQRKRKIKSKGDLEGLAVTKLEINTSRQLKSLGEPEVLANNKLEARTIRQWKWPNNSPCKWVFCCSALNASEKDTISEFTTLTGMPVSKTWAPNVTHVIASTDDKGVCRRTFKVLMGIIEGKWILKIDWLKACVSRMEPVEEEQFEINMDNHGFSGGPRAGRLRVINKEPKLFCGLDFHFMGDFTASYKGYLQELVIAAGGTVLQRRPIYKENLFGGTPKSGTYIIHGTEQPENIQSDRDHKIFIQRQNEAKIVANNCGAKLATNTWLLDSIVACTLLPEH